MRPDVAAAAPPEPKRPVRPVIVERVLTPEEEAEREERIAHFEKLLAEYKREKAAEEERRRGPQVGDAWEPPRPLEESVRNVRNTVESSEEEV